MGGVCLVYFLYLEPHGAARARLRETMLVIELTLPWVEVRAAPGAYRPKARASLKTRPCGRLQTPKLSTG